ncbi:LamG domain-containing protein, partial [Verrucomicrobia bacterium]|nr:LamG domain-containing protein [Verrucomicrobiota bacterium]
GGAYIDTGEVGGIENVFTVSAWFNSSSHSRGARIINWEEPDGQNAIRLEVTDGRLSAFVTDFGGSESDYLYGETEIETGIWYHATMVWNGRSLKVTVNGEHDGARPLDVSLKDIPRNRVIGIARNRSGKFWQGGLDDVRIYNRALSATEISQLYAYESQPQPSSNTRKASAMAQVVNGFIVGAEIIDGGYGYTSNPDVTITGEGGFGAIATATVSAGQVIKINIQNPGFGYTGNPTIDIAAPPVPPASAYATGEVVNGFLVGATLVTGGEAYNEAPQVTVTGGGGSGAVAVAQVENGRVVAVNIINPGNGYTSTPVITIAAPPSAPELSIRVTQVEVNMKLTVGKRYTIEASKNMVDWVQAGDLFTAEEQFKAMKFDVDDFGQFYRVIEQP